MQNRYLRENQVKKQKHLENKDSIEGGIKESSAGGELLCLRERSLTEVDSLRRKGIDKRSW